MIGRRRILKGTVAAALTSPAWGGKALAQKVAIQPVQMIDVTTFGGPGSGAASQDDHSAMFREGLKAAASARVPLRVPSGRYRLSSVEIPGGVTIEGAGIGKTVLEQSSGANDLWHTADPGSGDAARNTRGITIRNLTLQGTVARDGFQEVLHLMFTQGVSDLVVEDVMFSGWRGDALYVGTGNERGQNPSQVRHNERITIRRCIFDGETKNNRNAISFIDCRGALVEGSTFTRCSKADMPGCIDIEPDSGGTPTGTASVVKDIRIIGNRFIDNAGAAVMALNTPKQFAGAGTVPTGITFHGNTIDGASRGYSVGVSLMGPGPVTARTPLQQIVIRNNVVRNVSSPLLIAGVRGVLVEGNTFDDSRYSAEVGKPGDQWGAADVSMRGNTFRRIAIGEGGGNALFVYGSTRVAFDGNTFDACGDPANGYNANIVVSGNANRALSVTGNTFRSPVPNRNAWDVRFDGADMPQGTFVYRGNTRINVDGGTVVPAGVMAR